jgi:hypothetical protein
MKHIKWNNSLFAKRRNAQIGQREKSDNTRLYGKINLV